MSESALMDPAIAKALKEKEELQRRLAEIEQFLRLYKEFSKESAAGPKEKHPVGNGNESTQIGRKALIARAKIVGRPKNRPTQIVSYSRGILQDAGEPMTRGELVIELERKRVRLPGTDKE